jgi:multicomponent Na+:H+ antiporter subunit E
LLRAIGLGAILYGFWLVLSGHFEPLLMGFGVASSALVTYLAMRMDVARLILDPKLPISPILVHYRASQKTDLGRAIYANSITLTPGTITTRVAGDDLEIHSLTWIDVDGREEDEMDRRCTWVEQGGAH